MLNLLSYYTLCQDFLILFGYFIIFPGYTIKTVKKSRRTETGLTDIITFIDLGYQRIFAIILHNCTIQH